MVNTRSKTLKTCFSQAFIEEVDHQSGALVDDLLTEILIRLPVTSILCFKSVSKHWRSLLNHKDFTLRYANLIKTSGLFAHSTYIPLDAEHRSTPPFRRLDFCIDPSGIRIVQSCNGLLLCRSYRGYRGTRKYYVFNPTTKQFAILPSVPGGQKVCKTIRFMGLAYHQIDCPHYKVVCIRILEPGGVHGTLYQIQIYSSDTGKWKVSVQAFSSNCYPFLKGVYWNGAIHVITEYYLSHFCFKIDDEQLQTLPLPAETMCSVALAKYFGESRGHLHLIVNNYCAYNTLNLNVCEMLSDHSGWFVKYQVQLDGLPAAFPEMVSKWDFYYFDVINVVRGEKEEDTFLVLNILRKIIKYNIYDKSFRQIFSLRRDLSFGWCKAHHHIATVSSF